MAPPWMATRAGRLAHLRKKTSAKAVRNSVRLHGADLEHGPAYVELAAAWLYELGADLPPVERPSLVECTASCERWAAEGPQREARATTTATRRAA